MEISKQKVNILRKHYVLFVIFVSYNSLKVWEEVPPPTKAKLRPPFILVICHMEIDEEWVEAPFDPVIFLECTLGRLAVNI